MTHHERLLKQRNHVRAVASGDMSQLHTVMQVVTDANCDDARKLLGRLQCCSVELCGLDQQVLACVDDSLYNAELDGVYKHRTSLAGAIASLEGKLRDLEAALSNVKSSTSTDRTADELNERIPEMELTEFDGNPLNFEEFWDDFNTSVDQRADISTITKFKLLRKCLVGKAAAACKSYQLTKANYDQVKSILQERYGDKETAIALHLDALIGMKPAVSDAVSELVRVRDLCEMHIRALSILGFGGDAFGPLFAPIVLSKLPDAVRLVIRRQKKSSGDVTWTMKRLRELLSTEIELRASNEYECLEGGSGLGTNKLPAPESTETALLVCANGQPKSLINRIACAFCSGDHFSSNCTVYLDVASRQAQMGNRCFRCLRFGHWKADCRSHRKPCYYCRKRDHHCSLCLRKFGSPSQLATAAIRPPTTYEPQSYLPETACISTGKSSTGSAAGKDGVAMVESAQATVTGTTGSCQARLVFDCGSTKSFMSAQLVRRIGAKLVGYDSNAVGRFGEATRIPKLLARHEFSIVLRDGSHREVQMNAEERLAPSVILQPLAVGTIEPHCKPSDLAEILVDEPTETGIDILLGLDHYYSFLGQREVRPGNGLVLKDSSLGVIVTGYAQPSMSAARSVSQSLSVSDNTVPRERPQPRATSTSYSNLPTQHSKLRFPESWTSTLRALTSSPLRQTVV